MAKQKLTVQQKLAKRTVKQPNSFVWWSLSKLLVKPILQPKFHTHYTIKDNINDCKGPCFLIYNHQSRADYIWVTQTTYPRKVNFVIGHNEFFRSKFHTIFNLIHTIPKKNFTQDITSLRGIDTIIKSNGCVCFSPEGMSSIVGHNQPIVPGTGKFFKHYNIPVYILKIKGGYLTNHKVCLDDRLGRVDAELSLLLSPEKLQSMTDTEVQDYINEALWQDDYEWQKQEHIKWKTKGRICDHLHDICYKCPKCGAELEMIGEGNVLKCKACGNGAKMNDYYEWEPFDESCVLKESPSKWVDWERSLVIKEIRENPNYIFAEEVELCELPKYSYVKHNKTGVPCGKGVITIDHQGMHFKGERHGEPYNVDWPYSLVYSLVIVTDCTFFSMYVKGEYMEFHPKRPSVGKMLLLVEEMHRLHINTWKNFPWYDDMYKIEEKN